MNKRHMDRGRSPRDAGGMHGGNPNTSRRLRATMRLISRKRGATQAEVSSVTGSGCVHSDIAALRKFYGPKVVKPAEYIGKQNGNKVYRYRAEVRRAA